MGPDILSISVGETWRGFGVVAKASGSAITTGTVNYYLKCLTGANAGKWWKNSDQTWAVAETANAMTHVADGGWTINLAATPFVDAILYYEYAKESGDLHVAGEGRLLRGMTELLEDILAIRARTDLITTGIINVLYPVRVQGTRLALTIIRGDAYLRSIGNQIIVEFSAPGLPNDMSTATVTLDYVDVATHAVLVSLAGAFDVAVGPNKQCSFEMTAAQSEVLTVGVETYDANLTVLIEDDAAKEVTVCPGGHITVEPDVRVVA
jgi:hypothetical protein